ncbi:hypothetical protein COCNU_14G011200 [Cocos nucifera]|uniref:Uncharacterized protein n=1 Tax=Cocos nucifera TaxID=13894 RepID=A0A8K0NCW6_COCNU|nr:hypothetical protein COCNU_14G011200 [Cocos nucifera]
MAASLSSSAAKSFCHSFKRFFKAPWEITGPCADPEYRIALPKATEYRRFSPATAPAKACVPPTTPGQSSTSSTTSATAAATGGPPSAGLC